MVYGGSLTMIYLIVGHRGTGKTLWLKKLKQVFSTYKGKKICVFLDLDKEIEKKTKRKITHWLLEGENPAFRKKEKAVLNYLINKYKKSKKNVFIAVGAGLKNFSPPDFCHVIHLIRETDPLGRVFQNRPFLTNKAKPFKEYNNLYPLREKFYQKIKDESFVLPEWDFNFKETEKLFFNLKKTKNLNFILTLNKNTLPWEKKKWEAFIEKRLNWGLSFFELRDDEFTQQEIKLLLKLIPQKNQLLSFRKKGPSPNYFKHHCFKPSCFKNQIFKQKSFYDWPLEKGCSPSFSPPVLSLHKRKNRESFKALCQKLVRYKADHFKLAVLVKNFKELWEGHQWFLEDPHRRSFLPVSEPQNPGRWRWYRQVFGPYMKMNFVRESLFGIPDQPFLYEYLGSLFSQKKPLPLVFSAVLGDPVTHSASPAFHRAFFARRKMAFVKILLKEKEFTKQNLEILQKMGLIFSAVTSPLKKKAFKICDKTDSAVFPLRSVNTLINKAGVWKGFNTDIRGFLWIQKSLKKVLKPHQKVAVWGGGGVQPVLEKILSTKTCFYSARTGKPKKQGSLKNPEVIIWAVGRNRMPACQFPSPDWRPKLVMDLNYSSESPGLEYALKTGAKYISGKTFFHKQAKQQQCLFLGQ